MSDSKKTFKLSDDAIVVIRELVQLSLLTGTNIIDHFRAIHLEETKEGGYVTVTPEYVEAYQQMLKKLEEEAERMQAEAEKKIVTS